MEDQTHTEQTVLRLSEKSYHWLKENSGENGCFEDMADGYKFAIGLAIAMGLISPPLSELGKTETPARAGVLDKNQELYNLVKAIRKNNDEPVYATVERYAECGIRELQKKNDGKWRP
jgi:hypothetical protein